MIRLYTLSLALCCSIFSLAQDFHVITQPEIIEVINHGETSPLRDWDHSQKFENPRVKPEKLGYVPKKDWPLNTFKQEALHDGFDPVYQSEGPIHEADFTKAIDQNYDGMPYSGVNPSDNILDVGPNHVIQMMNGSSGAYFIIYDKSGNTLVPQTYLDNFFGANGGASYSGLGDPIVLYDAMADRWFMSEFQSGGNNIYMAVSTTPDPTGSWYFYSFTAPNFPDYLKFGVWSDMYIMTSNETGPNPIYAIDRTAMLAGTAPTTQRFTVPTYGSIGFQATTPVTHDGGAPPPAGAPGMFMRMGDDAWTGGPAQDQLELWSMDIDFANPANSVVSGPQLMPVSAFDTELCGYTSFSCIQQPGSATQLDPLREVLMNRVQYRNLGGHEAIVASHAVDVSGADEAGVRWYEVRRSGLVTNDWAVHQEGTYAPDTDSRWMSGIAMNAAGDIALMYNVSSSTTFPGIRYTGRYANDPLGQMTMPETSIIEGSSANGSNRYGDYNSLDSDPVTGSFWGTANYNPASQWATRVFEFSFPVLNCTAPTLTTNIVDDCANVAFNLSLNIGADGDASAYTVSYTVDGGAPISLGSNSPGQLNIGNFSFGSVIDLSIDHDDDPACNRTLTGLTSTGGSCCVAPSLSVSTVPDCANGLFGISLNIGTDGDAPNYDVLADDGTGAVLIGTFGAGDVTIGDYTLGSSVSIDVIHNGFPNSCDQTITEVSESAICNDDCANAETISCGTVVNGSTIGATTENPEPGTCVTTAGSSGGVWYTFLGQNSNNLSAAAGSLGDEVTLSLCDNGGSANYDSKIRVFSGSCGALTCVTGDDDGCTGTTSLVNFATAVGETYYVLVHGFNTNAGDFAMAVTCVAPANCLEPSALGVASITETTATLSWSPGASELLWDVEIGVAGFTPSGTATVSGLTSASYEWSGGQAATSYEFYVRADCGGGEQSIWVGPFQWTTLNETIPLPQGVVCSTAGSYSGFLYVEDFEDGAIGWTGDISGVNEVGSWEIPNESGSAGTGPDVAFSGQVYVNYEASGSTTASAELISSAIDLSDAVDQAELSFYMHAYGSDMGTMSVSVSSDVAGPWTDVFSWTGQLQTSGAEAWQPVGIDVSTYVGQTLFVRFIHTGTGGFNGDMSLDFVRVEACIDPNLCLAPSSLTAFNIEENSADLFWVAPSAHTGWELEIGLSGFAPTGTATATSPTDVYNASSLVSDTSYDYYVRGECNSGVFSEWEGPFTFTTAIDYCVSLEFVDNGGVSSNYVSGTDEEYIICPDVSSDRVEVTFTFFDVEDRTGNTVCWDQLFIFDGSSTADSAITPSDLGVGPNTVGGFCWDPINLVGTGDLVGQTIVSTHSSGCLTFRFLSDNSVSRPGWEATVACVADECPADIVPNGIVDIDDFLAINSAFGISCSDCPEDLNGDGDVNIDDFLILNSNFGNDCNQVAGFANAESLMLHPDLAVALEQRRGDLNPEIVEFASKMKAATSMFVFPNPNAGDEVKLMFSSDIGDNASIVIHDISGKVMLRRQVQNAEGLSQLQLNLEGTLPSGMYMIQVESANGVLSERFVVE